MPWHVLVASRNPDFLQFYFVHEHFDRFAKSEHRREGSPLYFVGFARPDNLGKVALPLTVTFVRAEPAEGKEQQAMEDFSVDDVVDASGESLGRSAVRYRLQTMLIENQTEAGYWLDTGVLQVRPD